MDIKHIVERYETVSVLGMILVLLLIPITYGYINSGGVVLGQKNFYHLRLGKEIISQGFQTIDTSIFGGRPYYYHIFHTLLAGVFLVFHVIPKVAGIDISVSFLYVILQLFNSGVAVWTLLQLMKLLNLENPLRVGTISMWFLMPPTIAAYFNDPSQGIMITLTLLGIYCFLKKFNIPTIIIAGILATDAVVASTYLLILWCLYWHKKQTFRMTSIATIIVLILVLMAPLLRYPQNSLNIFSRTLISNDLVFELGGLAGIGIIQWFLVMVGVLVIAEKRIWPRSTLLLVILGLMGSIWKPQYFIIISLPLAGTMGIGFEHLYKRAWQISYMKQIAVIAIILGIAFSYLGTIQRLDEISLSTEMKQTLLSLRTITTPAEVIFTEPHYGFWIEYLGRRVMHDELEYHGAEQRYNDMVTLFYSRDYKLTTDLLQKYSVDTLFITNDMKENLVWYKPSQGLLFLLDNSKKFKRRYYDNTAEMWVVG